MLINSSKHIHKNRVALSCKNMANFRKLTLTRDWKDESTLRPKSAPAAINLYDVTGWEESLIDFGDGLKRTVIKMADGDIVVTRMSYKEFDETMTDFLDDTNQLVRSRKERFDEQYKNIATSEFVPLKFSFVKTDKMLIASAYPQIFAEQEASPLTCLNNLVFNHVTFSS